MSAGDRKLNAGSRLDPGSQAWMDRLRSAGAERDQALARLQDLMLRVARREVARLAAEGHDPAHRCGNACAWRRWAQIVVAADPGDAGCDFTFQLLDRYVEAELRGPGPGRRFPPVAAHLRSCQDCHHDYQGLRAAASS